MPGHRKNLPEIHVFFCSDGWRIEAHQPGQAVVVLETAKSKQSAKSKARQWAVLYGGRLRVQWHEVA